MSSREPWPVRVYRFAAWTVGDLSTEAAAAFAALYEDERRRGRAAAAGLWLRAMFDLVRAGAIVAWPRLFAAFGHDLRWAWRTLRTRPGASVVIVASIGLAIGANTAAFSVTNAFLWRSWGSRATDEVVRVREDYARPGQPPDVRGFTMANFGPWQRANTVFEAMAAGTGTSATLVVDGRPERVAAGVVTANFFDVLGIKPAVGRTFTADEDTPARRDAVLLGDALWRGRFAADPTVVGRTVRLNGRVRTIVGVMPRGLKHPYQSDLWVPLGYREDPTNGSGIYVPARLKPRVTLAQANEEMDAMAARLWQAHPTPNTPSGAQVTWLRPEMLGRLTRVLYALSGTALLVLLIAVANVSNLLLAQGFEQQHEAAVRTALGASRLRLVRQFLTYGVMLAALGGAAGILLTLWGVGPLVALSPLYGAGEFDIEPRLRFGDACFLDRDDRRSGCGLRRIAGDGSRACARVGRSAVGRPIRDALARQSPMAEGIGGRRVGSGVRAARRRLCDGAGPVVTPSRDLGLRSAWCGDLRCRDFPARISGARAAGRFRPRSARRARVAARGRCGSCHQHAAVLHRHRSDAVQRRGHSGAGPRILCRALARRDPALLQGARDSAAGRPIVD
jgi:hypothetical protein